MSETIKDETIQENGHQEFTESTAVRVYDPSNSAGDFPVLKAFQEYLDAEQAKAHKRMLSLSVFFIVLLVIVVLTFTIITSSLISRSQSLSDRLMDLAKERLNAPVMQPAPAAAPIVNVQQPPAATPPVDNSKPILAKLEALEAELARARAAAADAEARATQLTKVEANKKKPSNKDEALAKSQADLEALMRQNEEIKRQQETIKAAREKLKAEQEALHKEEVEKQRRRLYPEYYAREDARRAKEEAAKNPPPALPAAAKPALPATPTSAVSAETDLQEIEKLLDQNDADEKAENAQPSKPKKPKESALKAILDQDDLPKLPTTTGEASKITDEEQKKIEAQLKDFKLQLDKIEAEEKKDADAKQKSTAKVKEAGQDDKSPSPAKEVVAAKTESLNVGPKDGRSIPWLVEIPGETPIEQPKDAGEKLGIQQLDANPQEGKKNPLPVK